MNTYVEKGSRMILSHRIQLKPRRRHEREFVKACGVARYAYNWGLERWQREYQEGRKPTVNKIKRLWNAEKPEWVYESPKDANQQPFTALGRAFSSFFKKKGKYPRFKKRGVRDSFYVSNDKLKLDGRHVRIPCVGWVKMTESLRFNGKVMSATVSREADRWFISLAVKVGHEPKHGAEELGVDLGVKNFATLSTAEVFDAPNKRLARLDNRLRAAQKRYARKKKGSSNRRKSVIKLQRLYRKIKNLRSDFLHKLSSRLVSRTKMLVIEDLNVVGMLKNRRLSRSIGRACFAEFRRQLQYKCEMNSVKLVTADRWFPSTQLCHSCGKRNKMSLSQRRHVCGCGYEADRDVNAALNLRTFGQRGINACGHSGLCDFGCNPSG